MTESAYIHIPFCKSKCRYCSFVSFTGNTEIGAYINSLLEEIRTHYQQEPLKTLYLGGGTPSLLNLTDIRNIIEAFNLTKDCEITFEMNPDDASPYYLEGLKNIGINRLSMGAQCFDDDILKNIGRRHNSQTIIDAVKTAKQSGFDNINLDLIYGLPKQSIKSLKKSVEKIIDLNIPHISTYGLKIEEGSAFFKNPPENLPDNDSQADMYIFINDILESNGFKRYEISNFAKEGYESRHNLNYWNNFPYYGFGCAAHGYENGVRYSNFDSLNNYINNPSARAAEHKVTPSEALEEEIFLGLRKTRGINIENINKKFSIDFENDYKKILEKYSPKYLVKDSGYYRLTTEGVLLSNIILSDFINI